MSNNLAHTGDVYRKSVTVALDPPHEPSLQFLYDTAPIGLAYLSLDCRYLRINQHLTEICGISVEGHLGHTVRECVPALADAVEAIVHTIVETGEPVTGIEVAGQNPGDTIDRSWITYWHPMRDPNGEIVGVNVAAMEITRRKQAEMALQASEQQFRTLADSIPQLVWMSDADGSIFWFNGQLAEFSALPAGEIAGQDWFKVLRPDKGCGQWTQSVTTGERFEMEMALRGRDGQERPYLTRVVPLHGPGGGVDRWLGTHIDIGELKRREEHIQFIAEELSHRSKNLLSVVIAIARQTVGQTVDIADYHARLALRLTALAQCNDLLVRDNWFGTPLLDLLAGQLKPFGGIDQERVEVAGPRIMLNAAAVQHLGLALHELATNASKYGALSSDAGRVTIDWTLDEEARRIRICWHESGGPAVAAPQRQGFGSIVIEQIVPRALKGKGTMEYLPEGVRWTFAFPA
ncbi:PAS domain-containing protein [Sphingomonas sp. dw_22]|uniref:PAS domain-containing protein n=1 Tax=Sphingomonas sp. dw_22 TaxID=2721175 RepID=UPI001BD22276|nr:PAS domain-containing protein [Sphingomonas sp. dw_22]